MGIMKPDPGTASYSLLDHTGDTGLLLRAPSLPELFRQAAHGFYTVLLETPSAVTSTDEWEIKLEEDDVDTLLVSWLSELNYHFSVLGKVYREYELQISGKQLQARLHGTEFDPDRHQVLREIKAITFHQLEVRQTVDQNWTAQVILDI